MNGVEIQSKGFFKNTTMTSSVKVDVIIYVISKGEPKRKPKVSWKG